MNLLDEAKSMRSELVANRRSIHRFAEVGFELPQTTALVVEKLREYGYEPQIVGKSGVVCMAGSGKKTFLLRADMDALPMPEATDYPFKADNGNSHSCGHDTHTAMLLGAAKLLKAHEKELKGCVKFMFQPAEEVLAGAAAMIADGILENPTVDAAMALHIAAGGDQADTGVVYHKSGPMAYSADAFKISVTGQDAHGSTPYRGVDAIAIAAHIVLALQNIVDKEVHAKDPAVVLVGKISGGTAVNTVAGTAELEVSTRSSQPKTREFIKQRITEIAEQTAKLFRGKAAVEFQYGIAPLINDPALTADLKRYCENLLGTEHVQPMDGLTGSEDFCMLAERVPSVLFTLGVGSKNQGYDCALHSPSLNVNEDALPVGAAAYACCALNWLKENG